MKIFLNSQKNIFLPGTFPNNANDGKGHVVEELVLSQKLRHLYAYGFSRKRSVILAASLNLLSLFPGIFQFLPAKVRHFSGKESSLMNRFRRHSRERALKWKWGIACSGGARQPIRDYEISSELKKNTNQQKKQLFLMTIKKGIRRSLFQPFNKPRRKIFAMPGKKDNFQGEKGFSLLIPCRI